MFPVHITPEKFENATITRKAIHIIDVNQIDRQTAHDILHHASLSSLYSVHHRPKPDEPCCLISTSVSLNSTSVSLNIVRLA